MMQETDASSNRAESAPALPPPAPPYEAESFGDLGVELCTASVMGRALRSNQIRSGEEIAILIGLRAHADIPVLTVGIEIRDESGDIAFGTNTQLLGDSRPVEAGHRYQVRFVLPANLNLGRYAVSVAAHAGEAHVEHGVQCRERMTDFAIIDYKGPGFFGHTRLDARVDWAPMVPADTGRALLLRRFGLAGAIYLVCLTFFAIDVWGIYRVPSGLIYVPLVLTALLYRHKGQEWPLAVLAVMLNVAGMILPHLTPLTTSILINRTLSPLWVFGCAALITYAREGRPGREGARMRSRFIAG